MSLHPMLAALRRHKAGVVLIALQIALTLAIVCNAIFIIGQRVERINRPSGLDESDLFMVSQQWVGAPSGDTPAGVEKLDTLLREDLAALRNMPDVVSATPTNSLPLYNSSWMGTLGIKPGNGTYDGASHGTARTVYYFTDEQALPVLGLKLAAGRFFNASEVQHQAASDPRRPAVMVISKALADKLFPDQDAVGKPLYLDGGTAPLTVVGVVARLQAPARVTDFEWNSTLLPSRTNINFSHYAVRARPGRLEAAMKAVPSVLYGINPMRVLDDDSVKAFSAIRDDTYRSDVGMAVLMGFICLILVTVTAAGIVGLTSFWVSQRHKQIGVRRALGARKIDILHYFQMENLVIAGAGAVIGTLLAIGLNFWLMNRYAMDRLPVFWVWIGVAVVLLLGQLAVFVPARRASNVSPVAATRAG